jgi:hypothetical protein
VHQTRNPTSGTQGHREGRQFSVGSPTHNFSEPPPSGEHAERIRTSNGALHSPHQTTSLPQSDRQEKWISTLFSPQHVNVGRPKARRASHMMFQDHAPPPPSLGPVLAPPECQVQSDTPSESFLPQASSRRQPAPPTPAHSGGCGNQPSKHPCRIRTGLGLP